LERQLDVRLARLVAAPVVALLLATSGAEALAAPPANDNFADAAVLSGPDLSIPADNRDATVEVGEPDHIAYPPRRTLWWRWTASSSRFVSFEAPYAMGIAVYTGGTLGTLTKVASDVSYAFVPYRASQVSFRALAGETYRIVASETGYYDFREFTLEFKGAPSNDDFANAGTISGGVPITVTGSNAIASAEAGEPAHGGGPAVRSVWWKWTAPASGRVSANICARLAIYTGATLGTLTPVASKPGGCGLAFEATAGVTYSIAVDGPGSAFLTLVLNPPPANDDFEDAATLTAVPGAVQRSNLAAGKETGEPDHAGDAGGSSLWWTWTPASNTRITVETCGSGMDTLLAVYTGATVEALTQVAASDTVCGNDGSVTFSAVGGQTYRIAVDGRDGAMGEVTLWLGIPPENDRFADASPIDVLPPHTSGTNVFAGVEPGEPAHGPQQGGRSVWWRWIAPATRGVVVNSCASSFPSMLSVYTGSAVDALTPVGSHHGDCRVAFRANQGSTYRIAVDGVAPLTGTVSLDIDPGPANDDFDEAATLSGPPGSASAANLGATKETGEPNHAGEAGGASLWWKWTPATTGPVRIDTCTGTLDTMVAVYTGASLGALTPVAQDDDSCGFGRSLLTFNAQAGTTYRIAVDAVGPDGTVQLALRALPINDAFASPTAMSGPFASVTGQGNGLASKEPGEPDHHGNSGGASVWYTWTAPAAGDTTVDTCDSDFDTLVAVYRGDALGSLTPLASDDDGCASGEGSFAEFTATDGTVYRIAVDGFYGSTGSFDLYVELTPPAECTDGTDNDGDGKIDGGDPGCSGSDDDDESDPPSPSQPTTTQPPPAVDKTAPGLALTGATTQRALRQRALLVAAACPAEACTVTAKATVSIPGPAMVLRLAPVTQQIAKGQTAVLKLKLRAKALTAVRRALRTRKRVRARVTVTAKDAAGNVATSARTIKLKR
jgi:hypothetical protein